jgi:probable phosphomutase (TIGR03848 family)
MTRIVLLRHAHSVANAKAILAGRTPGINLSERGLKESLEVADRLREVDFSAIRISPLERCSQTVQPLIERMNQQNKKAKSPTKIAIEEDLIEVDYGRWTGRKLSALSKEKDWKIVQNTPSAMYFPGGEGLLQVQARGMRALNAIAHSPGQGPKLLVSHGDVIKAIIAGVIGTHLDHFQKIVIDPASISILDFTGKDYRVLTLNNTSTEIKSFLASSGSKKEAARALLGGGAGRTGKR